MSVVLLLECSSAVSPVFDGHDVVEDGVDRGGEVVEAAGDVEEFLVDLLVDSLGGEVPAVLVENYVEQTLGVEGCPADEEREDDGGCADRDKKQ